MTTAAFPLVLASPLEKGPLVKTAQQCLTDNPWGRFYDGDIDGEYGPLTAQACYRAKFWCGYKDTLLNQTYGEQLHRLLQDGSKLSGEQIQRRKDRQKESRSKPLALKMVAEASRWIGTPETPPDSNIAHPFSDWWCELEWGMDDPFGFAWCAIYVSYCGVHAGSKAFNPKTACWRYCPEMVADALAGRQGIVLVKTLFPGCIVLFDWDGGVADHVGFGLGNTDAEARAALPAATRPHLERAIRQFGSISTAGGDFWTIEGNTGIGNDSNGGIVMIRRRQRRQVEVFAKVTR